MRILCFDPSGNWSKNEGKGSTGWALFSKDGELLNFGELSAEKYPSIERYWNAHRDLMEQLDIHELRGDKIVCESYKLQPGKAMQQSWSELETPQLIGFLRMWAWDNAITFIFQDPKDKVRVADPILEHKGIIEKKGNKYYCMGRLTNLHMRDAIRHGIYYLKYGKD